MATAYAVVPPLMIEFGTDPTRPSRPSVQRQCAALSRHPLDLLAPAQHAVLIEVRGIRPVRAAHRCSPKRGREFAALLRHEQCEPAPCRPGQVVRRRARLRSDYPYRTNIDHVQGRRSPSLFRLGYDQHNRAHHAMRCCPCRTPSQRAAREPRASAGVDQMVLGGGAAHTASA